MTIAEISANSLILHWRDATIAPRNIVLQPEINAMKLRWAACLFLGMLSASPVFASVIAEVEPNATIATAQNVNGNFSLEFVADIEGTSGSPSSTLIPHVTITGAVEEGHNPFTTTDPSSYSDFFSFNVLAGNDIFLDIDHLAGRSFPDALLILFDPLGVQVGFADDSPVGPGDIGLDPFISHTALLSGVYTVGVGAFFDATNYDLHISVEGASIATVPEPFSLALWSIFGVTGLAVGWRQRSVCLRRA
jgi:hypothetical protein